MNLQFWGKWATPPISGSGSGKHSATKEQKRAKVVRLYTDLNIAEPDSEWTKSFEDGAVFAVGYVLQI